jgi:hypothetical protein
MKKFSDGSWGSGHTNGGFSEIWTVIVAFYLTLGYYVTSYSTPLNHMNERMNRWMSECELRGRPITCHVTRNPSPWLGLACPQPLEGFRTLIVAYTSILANESDPVRVPFRTICQSCHSRHPRKPRWPDEKAVYGTWQPR